MEELFLDGHEMDVTPRTVAQTLQINELGELQDRQANYTNRIKLPDTPKNQQNLDHLGIVGNVSRAPYRRVPCKYKVEGIELIQEGYAQIKRTGGKIDVVVYAGNVSLFEAIRGLYINELNFDDINHDLDIVEYENSLTNTEGYIYALAHYGVTGLASFVQVERLAPAIFVSTLWDKIFTQAGKTYSGDIFQDAEFKKEVITATEGYDATADDQTVTNIGTVTTNTIAFFQGGIEVHLDEQFQLTASGLTDLTQVGDTIRVDYTGALRLTVNITQTVTHGTGTLIIRKNSGQIIARTLGQGDTVVIDAAVVPGDTFSFFLEGHSEFVSEFVWILDLEASLSMTFEKVEGGVFINFAAILSGTLKQSDLIKDIMQKYGILLQSRSLNHYEFTTYEAMLNDRSGADDWSRKLSKMGSETYSVGNYAQRNYAQFQYEEDNYTGQEVAPFDDGFFDVINENIVREKTILKSLFTKANLYRNPSTGSLIRVSGEPVYSVPIWEFDEDGVTVLNLTEGTNRFFKIEYKDVTYAARFFTAANSTAIDGPAPFLSHLNAGYQYYLNLYYPALKRLLSAPVKRTDIFNLTLIDILNLDFFKLKYIKQLGGYFYLNKVSNFRPGLPTKCEIVKAQGLTFNSPPTILGIRNRTITHGGTGSITLDDFVLTNPPYYDPEFDPPEQIKITSFGTTQVKLYYGGAPITSETIIPVSNISALEIRDNGLTDPQHSASFSFKIQSENNPAFSNVEGTLAVLVLAFVNSPPTADAGADRILEYFYFPDGDGQASIVLNGSNSGDPDGQSLTYLWTLDSPANAGTFMTLTPNITNPAYPTLAVDDPLGVNSGVPVVVRLRVTDPGGLWDEDTATIILDGTGGF